MTTTHKANETPTTPEIEELQTHIDETRAELGGTLEALTERLDVKVRAGRWLRETRARVPVLPVAGATVAIGTCAVAFVWHRRRR